MSTPDGENCGLVKNMSLLGLVSTQGLESVVEMLFTCGMEELMNDTSTPLCGKHKVLLNGDWVGLCADSESFVGELKSRRRQSELPLEVSSVSANVLLYFDILVLLDYLLWIFLLQKVSYVEYYLHICITTLSADGNQAR